MGQVQTNFLVRDGHLVLTFDIDGKSLDIEMSPSDGRLMARTLLEMLQKLPRDVPDPTVDPALWSDRPEISCGTDERGDVFLAFSPPGAASYAFTLDDETWTQLAAEIQRMVSLPRGDRMGTRTH